MSHATRIERFWGRTLRRVDGSSPRALLPSRAFAAPDFMIIGAQRSGTTSLFSWICEHPDVKSPVRKELHFFDQPLTRLRWRSYRAMFPTVTARSWHRMRTGRRAITGEATPSYLMHPLAPAAVAARFPTIRLVVVLRDPVERAISHFGHNRKRGREPLTFEDAIAVEAAVLRRSLESLKVGRYPDRAFTDFSYAYRGKYVDQLDRWREHFPAEQLLVLRFDDVVARPRETCDRVVRFLGLDPSPVAGVDFVRRNSNPASVRPASPPAGLRHEFDDSNQRRPDAYGITFDPTM